MNPVRLPRKNENGPTADKPGRTITNRAGPDGTVETIKIDNLFEQVRISVFANVLLGAIVSWNFLDHVAPELLFGWLFLLVSVNFCRWILADLYFTHALTIDAYGQKRLFMILTLASGMLWGLSVPLFLQFTENLEQQFLLIIVIAGLAAGSIPMLSAFLQIYLGYIIVLLVPALGWYVFSNDQEHAVIGVMTMILGAALASAGKNYAANFHRSQSLASELSIANIRTEHINSNLKKKINEALEIQHALRESEKRFHMAFEQAPIGMALLDHENRFVQVNPTLAELLAYPIHELTGKRIDSFVLDEDRVGFEHTLDSLHARRENRVRTELRLVSADGQTLWTSIAIAFTDPSGTDDRYMILQLQDITESVELSARLRYEAEHDELTGFVNRREFERRLARLLSAHRDHRTEHTLCYLDLDRFKVINDSEGHLAGDEMLRQVSALLLEHMRGGDTIARIGGDEFAILLEHCDVASASRFAETLIMAINEFRFFWSDKVFRLDLSIGIAPIEPDYKNTHDILRAADAACAAAKESGGARVHVYESNDEEIQRRQGEILWIGLLTNALDCDGFDLYAQPITPALAQPAISALRFEVLVRLHGNACDTLLPGAFLPAAERYGLAVRIDKWVIEAVFAWFRAHPDRIQRVESCAVNLSGASLNDKEFTEHLMKLVRDGPVPPSQLRFEITETAAISHLAQARHFMNRLQSLGCRFSLDDFGTGLSSFGYLRSLPVDTLKIDGQFVRDIVDDRVDRALVKSINDIGRVLGMTTVAECVENESTLELLREIGIDYIQGYYSGNPRPLAELFET